MISEEYVVTDWSERSAAPGRRPEGRLRSRALKLKLISLDL